MIEYNAIYLSPHLDDAVLSCGCHIFTQVAMGQRVLVVTLCAGDPPIGFDLSPHAQTLHERWQLGTAPVAGRRIEDERACQLLMAEYEHWDIPDCIYRRDPISKTLLYPTRSDVFNVLTFADIALVETITDRLEAFSNTTEIFAPLAIGGHVDHQLTRLAAERAFGYAQISYYEDFPYSREPSLMNAQMVHVETGWQATVMSINQASLQAKIIASACYESQVRSILGSVDNLSREIIGYAREVGGERIWKRLQKDAEIA